MGSTGLTQLPRASTDTPLMVSNQCLRSGSIANSATEAPIQAKATAIMKIGYPLPVLQQLGCLWTPVTGGSLSLVGAKRFESERTGIIVGEAALKGIKTMVKAAAEWEGDNMVVTNTQSGTNIDEVAAGIYRINTPVVMGGGGPGGFSFNQYLIVDDEPLLFHTGPRKMFSLVREAVSSIMPPEHLRYDAFSHVE